jgi:uncharacterized protein (TIGR02996 family)
MTDGGALLAAVLEHPGDDTPRLVYADWLDDHGEHDRADLIRVQCEAARLPACEVARGRVGDRCLYGYPARGQACGPCSRLLALDRRADWLHGTAMARPLRQLPWGMAGRGDVSRGFLWVIRPTLSQWQAHAPALLAAHPLDRVEVADVPGLAFGVSPPVKESPHWSLTGVISLPGDALPAHAMAYAPTRPALVVGCGRAVAEIVDRLRDMSGDRWPGVVERFPPGAVLRTRQGAL